MEEVALKGRGLTLSCPLSHGGAGVITLVAAMCVHIAIPEPTGSDPGYNQRSLPPILPPSFRRGNADCCSTSRTSGPRSTVAGGGAGNPAAGQQIRC